MMRMKFTEQSLAFKSFHVLLLGRKRNKRCTQAMMMIMPRNRALQALHLGGRVLKLLISACVVAVSRSMMRMVFTETSLAFI